MLPENDRWSETRAQLLAQMDVSMGGRVAEELIFGDDDITAGARLRGLDLVDVSVSALLWHRQQKYCWFQSSSCFLFILGASSDFDGATKIAKMMVTRFGMSDKVKLKFLQLRTEHFCPFFFHEKRTFSQTVLLWGYHCFYYPTIIQGSL